MSRPEDVLQALDDLERALEEFREAYTAWLEGERDGAALSRALTAAEARLDAARSVLASADRQSYPS